jgi:ABC-type dipeptide/oligopeptide/nickel transport system ATPase component
VDFTAKRKTQNKIQSLGDLKRAGKVNNVSGALNPKFVNGPNEFDCLTERWSRGEVLGIVADSGSGKTEVVLYSAKHILKNNPQSVFVFVSLEMTTQKIFDRWVEITKDTPELEDRFYIVSRYDDEGKPQDVSMGWILRQLVNHRNTLGDIASFAIDHLHIIGENDATQLNSIVFKVKEMAVELDSFGILLAQVSKGHGQKGEVPLGADAVYGCSQFKWACTDIIQVHRPIKRLEGEAGISVMAWGYAKIREPKKSDRIKEGVNKLLLYDLEHRTFRGLSNDEKMTFKQYYDMLVELKQQEEKFKAFHYDVSIEVRGQNGQVVKVPISTGYNGDEL